MKIDDVIVNVDPTIATEDDLKNFVANSKLQFPLGKLSKIVITANKNGSFDVDYSVKNQPNFLQKNLNFFGV